jgi:hypothetical protein
LLALSTDRCIHGPLLPADKQPLRDKTAAKKEWQKTANKVIAIYGEPYRSAFDYLEGLCLDTYWHNATLPALPWVAAVGVMPGVQEAEFILHQSVLDALAPKAPLRALWRR